MKEKKKKRKKDLTFIYPPPPRPQLPQEKKNRKKLCGYGVYICKISRKKGNFLVEYVIVPRKYYRSRKGRRE